jgi:hypothetical protein
VRPKFFAGQLLTEDDLGTLTDYVTAKNRLHNRYLFGAGVVCGLWVSCDPCGGGTVIVQPGYALDCCGNDLVLACPASLDVNAMIRDLRAARLGKDCGDPCADQGTKAGQDTESAGEQTASPTRHYLLYARYGEQDTDPVAPYATEEPCGQAACEPSRIREGISFVLKCPVDRPPPDDVWCRLRACQPSQDIIDRVSRLKKSGDSMTAAADAAEHRPVFSAQDAEQLTKTREALAEARKDPGQVRSATEYVRELAAALAHYDLAQDRAEYADISAARSELRDAAEALAGGDAAATFDPAGRPEVEALLSQAARLADPSAGVSDVELAMLHQGQPVDESFLGGLSFDAAVVQEWLLARLDSAPLLADCELRALVQAVPVTTAAGKEASALRSFGRVASQLVGLFVRVVTDCICAALNPPCAPCEDTDVLLACLEVRDCEVMRVCNADRDYVISGSALRYWLPTGLLHQAVEAFCCRPRPRGEGQPGTSPAGVPWELLGLPDPVTLLCATIQQRCGWPAPDMPQPPAGVPQPAAGPPVVGGADATAQQVIDLAQRFAELTERLAVAEAKLSQPSGPASAPPANTGPANTGRRSSAARSSPRPHRPAAAPGSPPAAAPGPPPAAAPDSPEAAAPGSPPAAAPDSPEAAAPDSPPAAGPD